METRNKIIKTARTCYIITKILYGLSCVACVVFAVLACTLAYTDLLKEYFTPVEAAILFGILALYSFFVIGLLWNVEYIFKSMVDDQSPFSERVSHYLKKIAGSLLMLSTVPALVGSVLLRVACPQTEFTFPIDVSGILAGVILLFLGMFFRYGKELQKKDDETL